jgi:hypothetical protein
VAGRRRSPVRSVGDVLPIENHRNVPLARGPLSSFSEPRFSRQKVRSSSVSAAFSAALNRIRRSPRFSGRHPDLSPGSSRVTTTSVGAGFGAAPPPSAAVVRSLPNPTATRPPATSTVPSAALISRPAIPSRSLTRDEDRPRIAARQPLEIRPRVRTVRAVDKRTAAAAVTVLSTYEHPAGCSDREHRRGDWARRDPG